MASRPDALTAADSGRENRDGGNALDHLTAAQIEHLAGCLPTEQEIMVGWATPVLAASELERRSLVAHKIEVLRGLYDDPAGWCARALRLAAEAGGRHAD